MQSQIKKNLVFSFFVVVGICLLGAMVQAAKPSTKNFTADEMKSVLKKTALAVDIGFFPNSNAIVHMTQNSREIYPLPSDEYQELHDRILVLPSSQPLKERPICLVAQGKMFRRIVLDNSAQALVDNLVLFKDLPAEEKTTLKKEMLKARLANKLPAHCSFEYL